MGGDVVQGGAEMDVPFDGAVVRVEGVEVVLFGGDDDPSVGEEGLGVDRGPVEGRAPGGAQGGWGWGWG